MPPLLVISVKAKFNFYLFCQYELKLKKKNITRSRFILITEHINRYLLRLVLRAYNLNRDLNYYFIRSDQQLIMYFIRF